MNQAIPPKMRASFARDTHKPAATTAAPVHAFPTSDEGGITGVPEGGTAAVDECGPAVTAGHFNPLFVTPGLAQGQAQTLYEIGDFTGKFGPLAAAAATVGPGPRPRSPALKPRPSALLHRSSLQNNVARAYTPHTPSGTVPAPFSAPLHT